MTSLRCNTCGAELLRGTGFCRRCGAAVQTSDPLHKSEQPTAIFPEADDVTTQRLQQPRPTSPAISSRNSWDTRRNRILLLLLIGALVCTIAAIAILSDRWEGSVDRTTLLYPGAKVVLDMTNTDGSRSIQLETGDALDRVESWYQNNVKMDKTLRLTSNSVVMKNQKVTVTLALEDTKTHILIKQLP